MPQLIALLVEPLAGGQVFGLVAGQQILGAGLGRQALSQNNRALGRSWKQACSGSMTAAQRVRNFFAGPGFLLPRVRQCGGNGSGGGKKLLCLGSRRARVAAQLICFFNRRRLIKC